MDTYGASVPEGGVVESIVHIRRLSMEVGRRLAVRLSGGDAALAERIVAKAMKPAVRTVSTAALYGAWRREKSCGSLQQPLSEAIWVVA